MLKFNIEVVNNDVSITLTIGLGFSILAIHVVVFLFGTIGILSTVAVLLGVLGLTALMSIVIGNITGVFLCKRKRSLIWNELCHYSSRKIPEGVSLVLSFSVNSSADPTSLIEA